VKEKIFVARVPKAKLIQAVVDFARRVGQRTRWQW